MVCTKSCLPHRSGRSAWIQRAVGCLCLVSASTAAAQWPQWGGPNRDFKVDGVTLASQWPEEGPKILWERTIGEGNSGIASSGDLLFTMYRAGLSEIVIALDSATGEKRWLIRYEAPVGRMRPDYGLGPHTLPLVVKDRVFTVGVGGWMHALDARSGGTLWKHDLKKEYDCRPSWFGFSSSPLAYRDLVIVAVGGAGHGVVAFRQEDGAVVWRSQDFLCAYSSPTIINLDGKDQLIVFMSEWVAGMVPETGVLEWKVRHKTKDYVNAMTPVWGEGNILFVSSAYGKGSRALRLTRNSGGVDVEELWSNREIQVHYGTAIRLGDYIYTSSGGETGPIFTTGFNVRDGKIAWRNHAFGKAQFLYADGKLIILDEDGYLAIATPTPEALMVHSSFQLLKKLTRTPPTLVGTTLYVRQDKRILAVDLG